MRNSLSIFATSLLIAGCLDAEDSTIPQGQEPALYRSLNVSPTITGEPPTAILHGSMYDFEPFASDSDGDDLNFSVVNLPSWAQFDSSTGRLYGIPTLSHVGTYGNVLINAMDSENSVSLRPFSITVVQAALGTVTLDWLPPTRNADGTPIVDLTGYKIFYGMRPKAYDHEIRVPSPGVTTYVVENLAPGTYYFAATSIRASGVESDYSDEILRIVN